MATEKKPESSTERRGGAGSPGGDRRAVTQAASALGESSGGDRRVAADTASALAEAPAGPAAGGRRLVVVSNRLPFVVDPEAEGAKFARAPGGLVSALEPVLAEHGGVWVGWNGVPSDEAPDLAEAVAEGPPGLLYRPVRLTARELSRYYDGFSNHTLWPLFHYFVGRIEIDARTWRAYDEVNERFARAAAQSVEGTSTADALFWIHDYQLLRAPHHLRRMMPRSRIAFFLHIPFPASDVFRVLPWSRSLLRSILAADLVGLHVRSYAMHFMTCAERLLGCEVDRNAGIVHFEGREVSVQAHPVGVDVAMVERLAARAGAMGAGADGMLRVLGVDRLDYSKGIHERLLAIERLLERHPEYLRRVVFTQVLVPSRERVPDYGRLKREIDEAVGRINGRFSERKWAPVRYMARSLPPEELIAHYRRSDVALVTPLRDGMNLVAKEYAAAQLEDDGVLILSELAGAAEEMQEALLVNPFDVDAVAEALDAALSMPDDERRARMSALRDRVRVNDVRVWVRRFLDAAESASDRARATLQSPVVAVQRRLAPWLAQRPTVALFLDYDGTLTPIAEIPDSAVLSEAAQEALAMAARAPNLDVVIVSGRSLADLKSKVGIPGLTYVGNHGFEIEGPGLTAAAPDIGPYLAALEGAARDLEQLEIEGGWLERKGATLSYHLRPVAVSRRPAAVRQIRAVLKRRDLEALVGAEVVDGRPPVEWHKGAAVLHVLRLRHGADWISRVRALYLGDDASDEEAFRSLRGIGRAVCIRPPGSPAITLADYSLPDPTHVAQIVKWLASGGFRAAG